MTQDTDFNVAVPTEELERKPSFLMPNGWYESTFQGGAELASNDNGWQGVRIPFSGFRNKADGKTYAKDRRYQITTKSDNADAKRIGREQLTAVAVAFGLAKDVTVNGKPAKQIIAGSAEEFVAQLNAVAGSPCDVYVTTKARKRDGAVVQKEDGSGPVQDNEISRVAPLGQGK